MPVLKVKKNGVWKSVGGVAGGSNLPDYTEEDYGKVLSPSAEGLTWAEQTGGTTIITQPEEPTDVEDGTLWVDTDEEENQCDIFIVTCTSNDDGTITASHSAYEIKTMLDSGIVPYLRADMESKVLLYPVSINETVCLFGATMPVGANETQFARVAVNSDKSITDETVKAMTIPVPTDADYGKVLSATADGLVWVEQQSGGGIVSEINSVEGVEF